MILIDGISTHEAPGLRYKNWSHMVSTRGEDELHEFAARLGLRRDWAQLRPKASAAHYDIVPTKRAMALKLGAVEVTGRDLVRLNYDGLTRRGIRGDADRAAADREAMELEARHAPRTQTSFVDDDVQKTRERDAEREGTRRTRGDHRKPRPAPAIIVAQLGQDDDDT